MRKLSRNYVEFLERVVFSLLAERGKSDLDEFKKIDLDLGPNDQPETYTPLNVKTLIVETTKKFINNGYK